MGHKDLLVCFLFPVNVFLRRFVGMYLPPLVHNKVTPWWKIRDLLWQKMKTGKESSVKEHKYLINLIEDNVFPLFLHCIILSSCNINIIAVFYTWSLCINEYFALEIVQPLIWCQISKIFSELRSFIPIRLILFLTRTMQRPISPFS